MPAAYIMQELQFGSNTLKVPGHEVDIIAENQPAHIEPKLADPSSGVWDLVFSYEAGGFYLPNAIVPGIDKATIQSWYNKEGVGGVGKGLHMLSFMPFIVDMEGPDTGFAQATHFVDFSQPTPNDSWINTDTIATANVVGTVHQELPEYVKHSNAMQYTNQSIVITTTSTHAVFDKIFVYAGGASPVASSLSVPKGQTALALAIYEKQTTTSSKEISTIQFPKIPKSEWPELVAQIVNEVVLNQQGEIYEYLNSRQLAGLDAAARKSAVAAITQHVEQLTKVKTTIAGLG
jgi:hypothetical protein